MSMWRRCQEKGRDNDIKVYCFLRELWEGAGLMCAVTKAKAPAYTCLLDIVLSSKTPLTKKPTNPPGGGVSGREDVFVQPTALSPS